MCFCSVMLTCRVPLTSYLLIVASDETPDDQLEVVVHGKGGVASRFVADDSLAIFQMHHVGLTITLSNPVESSLQNNCTVL
jgi:hypothetical protein